MQFGYEDCSFAMNFQQLRSVRETVRCGFNLTEVANVLHTSQPGVSRQIRELEEELGVEIFVRAGKRLTGLIPAGIAAPAPGLAPPGGGDAAVWRGRHRRGHRGPGWL